MPAELLDAFCERKVHPRSGERMKFFDRHLSQKQCRQVGAGWRARARGGLLPSRQPGATLAWVRSRPRCPATRPSCPLPRICRPRHHPVCQVWALLAHYEGKLCTEYDCPCGWQRSLAPKVGA